jgi:type II secretory pathway pseudopilin PulG
MPPQLPALAAIPPVPAPVMPAPVVPMSPEPQRNRAVDIIWQWVNYLLWQWTLFAATIFLSATLTYYFVHEASGYEVSVYSLATVLCLLPAAMIIERIYSKREPREKHGFASVVLVLNAVLVFIAMIGGAIAAVISILWLIVNGEGSATNTISIISSLTTSVLSTMLFVRMIRAHKVERLLKFFPLVVAGLVAVSAVFALAGPFRSLVASRTDRRIEENVGVLNAAIQDYTTKNDALPASLDDLDLKQSHQSGAKSLVKHHLVTYTKDDSKDGSYTLPYELCMTFKKSKGSGSTSNKDVYSVTYEHGSGKQCYDQSAYGKTPSYNDYNYPTTNDYTNLQ